MISTEFAPNERWSDAWLSLKLNLQPWRWREGSGVVKVREQLGTMFPRASLHLFLSGRSSLLYLLQSLNLPKRSPILVQAFTCEAVVLPILELGLEPRYIDIDPTTYSMHPESLEEHITKDTKVVILQHTFGIVPDRSGVLALAKKHGLIVIEDLAHGFDPETFSDDTYPTIKLLSFGRSKAISSVFGGAVVTSDENLGEKLTKIEEGLPYPSPLFIIRCLLYKRLTVVIKSTYDVYLGRIIHGITRTIKLLIPEITQKEKRGSYDTLFNKRFPNALAELLNHQLASFENIRKKRADISALYTQELKSNLIGPLIRYPLLVKDPSTVKGKMREHGVALGSWYDQVVAPKGLNLETVGYRDGECPEAERVAKHVVNLPTNVTRDQAMTIIKKLQPYL